MIRNYEYAELFLQNDVQKNLIITDGIVSIAGGRFVYNDYTYVLTNDDLKSVPTITEMLTDEKSLDFGRCNSNYIEFSIAADVIKLIGKKCRVYMYLDDRVETIFKVGVYYITSDKATADRNYRNIVAYDILNQMNNADVTEWYNAQFPTSDSTISVANFRASFCQHFGILDATDTSEMVNDSVTFGKTISASEGGIIDGNTILRAICSANGGFGNIDRDGKFRCICLVQGLVGLYPAIDLYPAEDLYPREEHTTIISQAYYIPPLAYEDYYTESITKLCIRDDDDSIGVTVGEDGNDYILEGNFIFFNKSSTELEEIATRLLGRIKGLSYMPYDVRAFGNPCFEVGDAVRFRTGDVRVNSYILKRVLKGTMALEDQYQSVGNQYRDENAGDLSKSVQKLVNKTAKLTKNIDGISVELEDFESDVQTEFRIQQGQINLKVSQGDVSSSLSVESGQVTLNSNRLVVDSTNFKLDANGNATFSGTVSGATISSSNIISTGTWNGQAITTQLYNGVLECYDPNHIQTVTIGYGEIIVGSNTDIRSGSITLNGYNVLTTNSSLSSSKLSGILPTSILPTIPDDNLPSTISLSQIQNLSGNTRINIDSGSSAYNIVLNGSVNIGNGSSNTIRIRGKDVKWVTETINGTPYKILVEDA